MTLEPLPPERAPRLVGSQDRGTGQIYFPPRALAADGSLRPCDPVTLSDEGALVTWTTFAGEHFGQVDLPEGVRLQGRLGEGPHRIGANYRLAMDGDEWSFARV